MKSSDLFLNTLTEEASTTDAGNLFQTFTTLWLKKHCRSCNLFRWTFSFIWCPRNPSYSSYASRWTLEVIKLHEITATLDLDGHFRTLWMRTDCELETVRQILTQFHAVTSALKLGVLAAAELWQQKLMYIWHCQWRH